MKTNMLEATVGISRKINMGNYEMKEIFFSAKIDVANLSPKKREQHIKDLFEQVEYEIDTRIADLKPKPSG